MSIDFAATVLGGLIFVVVVYVFYLKVTRGTFPKVRNPFYYPTKGLPK